MTCQLQTPADLCSGKNPCTHLVGHSGGANVQKKYKNIFPTPGFEPQTVQTVACHHPARILTTDITDLGPLGIILFS